MAVKCFKTWIEIDQKAITRNFKLFRSLVAKKTKIWAVVSNAYWHGFPRAFSSAGNVLINGKLAKVLGRVSMDLIVVDVSDIKCKVGDKAVIIGKQGREQISAPDAASQISTTHYELLTRINPLIERVVV